MNVVAKAKRYGRWWLLKGLAKEKAQEAGYQQRLRKEFELLMQLQHQNIVSAIGLESVEDLGECIVMEYVDGMTLKEWLSTSPSITNKRKIAKELIEFTNTRSQNWYFSQQDGGIFVHNSNSSATFSHVRRSARYFRYYPSESVTNFFASFLHSLSHIEE